MRRTLEITSHLLTYRERIYARIHFGAYVHTADEQTADRNTNTRIQEISGSSQTRTGRYYLAAKFKRYRNNVDNVRVRY